MSMIQKHCYECGTALTERELEGEGIVPYCPQCGQFRFPMYNVAVSMVVINELTGQILLIRQYGKPHFILVAGYVNRGEQLEHAVCREVKEETGMTVTHVKFNRTKFFEPSNTLMCNFTAFVADASEFNPNKEIDSYQWFSPDDARKNIKENSLAAAFLNAYLDYRFYDTLTAARRQFGHSLPNHQLHTVAAACGYDLHNHHHALADAEACAAIALYII